MKEQLEMKRIGDEGIVKAIWESGVLKKGSKWEEVKIWIDAFIITEHKAVADAQLQDNKIVMDNVKRAMKKEFGQKAICKEGGYYFYFSWWQDLWQKWVGEDNGRDEQLDACLKLTGVVDNWIDKPESTGKYWLSPFCDGRYIDPRTVRIIRFGKEFELVVDDGGNYVKLSLFLKEYYPKSKWLYIPSPGCPK